MGSSECSRLSRGQRQNGKGKTSSGIWASSTATGSHESKDSPRGFPDASSSWMKVLPKEPLDKQGDCTARVLGWCSARGVAEAGQEVKVKPGGLCGAMWRELSHELPL